MKNAKVKIAGKYIFHFIFLVFIADHDRSEYNNEDRARYRNSLVTMVAAGTYSGH